VGGPGGGDPAIPIQPAVYNPVMSAYSRIVVDPMIRCGKPTIKGTRITVQDILEYMAGGDSEEDLLAEFPQLTSADIRECLAFAADRERYTKIAG